MPLLLLILFFLPFAVKAEEMPELTSNSFKAEATESRYVLSSSLTVSNSTRTSDMEIEILPGGKLTVTGNIALTTGHLRLTASGGGVAIGSAKTWTVSAGSVIDLSHASTIELTDNARIRLQQGATLKMCDTPITIKPTSNLTSSGVVEARQAVLVAPPVQVFGQGINVTGDWIIDCAYPQWFMDSQPYASVEEASKATSHPDWGAAINKAIKMKNSGEVRLPRGVYTVAATISLHYGIRLTGAGGITRKSDNGDWVTGTVLYVPTATMAQSLQHITTPGVKSKDPYIVTSNLSFTATGGENTIFSYPNQPVTVENIAFCSDQAIINTHKVCAIYSHGSINCRHLLFQQIATAVTTSAKYSDTQTYFDLHYVTPTYPDRVPAPAKNDGERYAFYLQGNGDAFRFEQCSVDYANPVSALFLGQVNGGAVVNNILNSRVTIATCRPLTFTGNHMESGAMLEIRGSQVNVESNFFEKGRTPMIRIVPLGNNQVDMSVVNIAGNQFDYQEGLRFSTDKNTQAEIIRTASPYDITLPNYSNVRLSQSYRNCHPKTLANNFTSGLVIGLETATNITPLDEFNKRSGYLTPDCQISWGTVTDMSATIPTSVPNNLYVQYPGVATEIPWFIEAPSGDKKYRYKYRFLPEGTDNSTALSTEVNLGSVQPTKDHGIYMQIVAGATAQRGRLYVERYYNGKTWYVYVPVCFTRILYDNGLTLSSYPWKTK